MSKNPKFGPNAEHVGPQPQTSDHQNSFSLASQDEQGVVEVVVRGAGGTR